MKNAVWIDGGRDYPTAAGRDRCTSPRFWSGREAGSIHCENFLFWQPVPLVDIDSFAVYLGTLIKPPMRGGQSNLLRGLRKFGTVPGGFVRAF
jgi:hypothetical protein